MGSGISKSAGAGISARPETQTFVFNADGYFRAKDTQKEVAARGLPKNSMDAFDSFNVKDPVSQDNHIPEDNGDLLFEDAEMAIEVCAVSRLLHSRILNLLTPACLRSCAHLLFPKFIHAKVMKKMGFQVVRVATGLDPSEIVYTETAEDGSVREYQRLCLAPLKARKRAEEKVGDDYGGNFRLLCDAARCSLLLASEAELESVTKYMVDNFTTDHPDFRVVRLKNRFKRWVANPHPSAKELLPPAW